MPAFSVSASAQEVDGNTVYTYWYIDNVEDLQLFENTIVSLSNPYTFNINATIILNEPIPSNTLFDLDIGLEFDSYADPSVEVQFVEPGFTVIGNAVVDIVDNRIAINHLQFDYDITRLYLKFYVTYPTWTTIQTVYDFTIDGVTYECEANQTWSAWCSSSYNTLGLFVDEGYIYYENGDSIKTLYSGDSPVNNYDLVDKDKTYYLKENTPAVTVIQFYIGNNSCTAASDMTWDSWVNSEYNTLSLIVDGTSLYTSDKSAILANNGIPVISTNKIIEGNTYTLSPYSVNPTFIFNGQTYEYEEGMTWDDYINSSYNVYGFQKAGMLGISTSSGAVVYGVYPNGSENGSTLLVSKIADFVYFRTKDYNPASLFSRYRYEFDFSITSVNVTLQDEGGLLNGIISWLKKVVDTITGLPSKIGDMIKGLFVPSEEELESIFDKFEALLKDRFGIAYDAIDIIGDFESAFKYSEGQSKVSFPSVTVNLAGTEFTFGGWDVNLIPVGFEGLVDALKLIVNLVSTIAFVFAVKHRYEEILRR